MSRNVFPRNRNLGLYETEIDGCPISVRGAGAKALLDQINTEYNEMRATLRKIALGKSTDPQYDARHALGLIRED